MEEVATVPCCDKCGARLSGRWEKLTPGLCRTLVKMWLAVVAKNENRVHLQTDLDLDKNAYNNFQKLRYFGLVAKVKDAGGCWLITRRGGLFLHGKERVSKRVLIFRNHIEERSEEKVSVLEAMKAGEAYWPRREDFFIEPVIVSAFRVQRIEQTSLF